MSAIGRMGVAGLRITIDTLLEAPRELVCSLSSYALDLDRSYLVRVSVLARIAEEVGCRGFLLVPREYRHGPES